MDVSEIIGKTDHAQFGRRFLESFLERGLGTMGKREIDVLVMHLLEEHAALDLRSNHDLSMAFRLTEARVRGLRYEAKLKYPPTEKKYVERRLLYVLAKAQYEADAQKIVFVVEDSYLRNALQAHLKSKGAFADNSFNSELVKVGVEQLAPVLEGFYTKKLAAEFVKEMKGAIKKEKFLEVRKAFVLGAARGLGAATVTAVKGLLGSG